MLTYCYTLTPDDNETWLIQFPDIPEAAAVAETAAEVDHQAREGLEAALQLYVDARRPWPEPVFTSSAAVTLEAAQTAKLLISNEMVKQGIKKAELARLLQVHAPQIDRLLTLGHASKLETMQQAATVLGQRLQVTLVPR